MRVCTYKVMFKQFLFQSCLTKYFFNWLQINQFSFLSLKTKNILASGDMVSPVHSNSSRGNSPINEGSNISQTPPTSNTITGQQINNNNNNNNSPVGTNSSKNGASDGGSNGYSAVGQPIQQVRKVDIFCYFSKLISKRLPTF